jgi:hypothetical protein
MENDGDDIDMKLTSIEDRVKTLKVEVALMQLQTELDEIHKKIAQLSKSSEKQVS